VATDRGHYRAIHSVLIDSPEFLSLSPDAKLLFYTLRLCTENNMASIFLFHRECLPRRTGLTAKEVEAGFTELEIAYWIAYQDGILWIRNGLRFDPNVHLTNAKHLIAVERVVNGLPKSEIVAKFIRYYSLSDSLLDRLSIPYAIQDKEKEKEKDISSLRTPEPSGPEMTVTEFIESWNEICGVEGLPLVKALSNGRTRKIKARLKSYPTVEFWGQVFNGIVASPFLMGRVGDSKWRATIDWVIRNDENPLKVAEGGYG